MQVFRKMWLNFLYKLPAKTKIKVSMSINKNLKIFVFILVLLFILLFISAVFFSHETQLTNPAGIEYAKENYQKEVNKYASKYKISSSYLMALIMLESSGRKYIKPRFEKHIYYKLLKLRDNRIDHFEDLKPIDLKGMNNEQVKVYAKSYGPFQIMGYKTIKMGITVKDLQGKNSIKYGVYWINREYGDLLRNGRFMDAFHIHNTGISYPKSGRPSTHNPKYVQNGLEYLKYFSRDN